MTAGRREQRRQHRQGVSRAQLLDAAEEVFGVKGYHEATLKEVAELAEFSVGSVYSFFENKDDLFRQIFRRRGGEFMTGMRAVLTQSGTPTQRLHALLDFQVGFFREHRHFARLFLRYSTATLTVPGAETDNLVRDNYDEAMMLQTKLFVDGQRQGEFCDGNPAVLARLYSGLVSAFQASDPAVLEDAAVPELLALAQFHQMVEATFAAPRRRVTATRRPRAAAPSRSTNAFVYHIDVAGAER